ncbi:MAG TPA: hypothetical protein VGQ83_21650, partial [Polyangia bacterium]
MHRSHWLLPVLLLCAGALGCKRSAPTKPVTPPATASITISPAPQCEATTAAPAPAPGGPVVG